MSNDTRITVEPSSSETTTEITHKLSPGNQKTEVINKSDKLPTATHSTITSRKPLEELLERIAKLSNLPSVSRKLIEEIIEIINYVDKLKNINTENIEPTSQVTGLENVTREDVAIPSLSQEEALQNTKSVHNGFFKVPAILDND